MATREPWVEEIESRLGLKFGARMVGCVGLGHDAGALVWSNEKMTD